MAEPPSTNDYLLQKLFATQNALNVCTYQLQTLTTDSLANQRYYQEQIKRLQEAVPSSPATPATPTKDSATEVASASEAGSESTSSETEELQAEINRLTKEIKHRDRQQRNDMVSFEEANMHFCQRLAELKAENDALRSSQVSSQATENPTPELEKLEQKVEALITENQALKQKMNEQEQDHLAEKRYFANINEDFSSLKSAHESLGIQYKELRKNNKKLNLAVERMADYFEPLLSKLTDNLTAVDLSSQATRTKKPTVEARACQTSAPIKTPVKSFGTQTDCAAEEQKHSDLIKEMEYELHNFRSESESKAQLLEEHIFNLQNKISSQTEQISKIQDEKAAVLHKLKAMLHRNSVLEQNIKLHEKVARQHAERCQSLTQQMQNIELFLCNIDINVDAAEQIQQYEDQIKMLRNSQKELIANTFSSSQELATRQLNSYRNGITEAYANIEKKLSLENKPKNKLVLQQKKISYLEQQVVDMGFDNDRLRTANFELQNHVSIIASTAHISDEKLRKTAVEMQLKMNFCELESKRLHQRTGRIFQFCGFYMASRGLKRKEDLTAFMEDMLDKFNESEGEMQEDFLGPHAVSKSEGVKTYATALHDVTAEGSDEASAKFSL